MNTNGQEFVKRMERGSVTRSSWACNRDLEQTNAPLQGLLSSIGWRRGSGGGLAALGSFVSIRG
jgi:hypothetical protein